MVFLREHHGNFFHREKKCALSIQNTFFQKFLWVSVFGISYDGYKIDMAIYFGIPSPYLPLGKVTGGQVGGGGGSGYWRTGWWMRQGLLEDRLVKVEAGGRGGHGRRR